tara:strand:- start:17392 stop:17649 length:258 start_codon:yes stop_codon:yes gene_type:complete
METLKKGERKVILDEIERIYISKGISGFENLIKSYSGPTNKKEYIDSVYQIIIRRGFWGSFDSELVEKLLAIEIGEVDEALNPQS